MLGKVKGLFTLHLVSINSPLSEYVLRHNLLVFVHKLVLGSLTGKPVSTGAEVLMATLSSLSSGEMAKASVIELVVSDELEVSR